MTVEESLEKGVNEVAEEFKVTKCRLVMTLHDLLEQ